MLPNLSVNTSFIVPTPVGVNRGASGVERRVHHCPHARGGEPGGVDYGVVSVYIVPTPVGVNRARTARCGSAPHCPHARGGEPVS